MEHKQTVYCTQVTSIGCMQDAEETDELPGDSKTSSRIQILVYNIFIQQFFNRYQFFNYLFSRAAFNTLYISSVTIGLQKQKY